MHVHKTKNIFIQLKSIVIHIIIKMYLLKSRKKIVA